jgi:hypothetical protein
MQKSSNYGLALANASEVGDWIAERWPEHHELPSEQRLAMACFSIAREGLNKSTNHALAR